jgi:hypothetical protein
MRVYASDSDAPSANGHAPDAEREPESEEEVPEYTYETLFKAPSYSDFIKTPPSGKARDYEKRVQSMMKAGMVASIHAENWPDAATFIKHGPGFAKAAGNLAAEDARAAQFIDMCTAPDSPYVMFAMVAIPLIAQLARNHQPEIVKATDTFKERRAAHKEAKRTGVKLKNPTPPITVHLFKRDFKLPIRIRVKMPNWRNMFKAFLAPTQYPNQIAQEVFNDEAVVRQLHKMGLYPRDNRSAGEDQA